MVIVRQLDVFPTRRRHEEVHLQRSAGQLPAIRQSTDQIRATRTGRNSENGTLSTGQSELCLFYFTITWKFHASCCCLPSSFTTTTVSWPSSWSQTYFCALFFCKFPYANYSIVVGSHRISFLLKLEEVTIGRA